MCCGVSHDSLWVRVGERAREQVLAMRHVTPMKIGAKAPRAFVRIARAGIASEADLKNWVGRGVNFAEGLKTPSRRASVPRSTLP